MTIYINGFKFPFLTKQSQITVGGLCALAHIGTTDVHIYRGDNDQAESSLTRQFFIKDGDRFSIMRRFVHAN